MRDVARSWRWGLAESLEPGPLAYYWEYSVFRSVFKNSLFSSECCRPHPSPGHRNVSAAVFSSQLLPVFSAGIWYQRPSPQLPGALDGAKRSAPALESPDLQHCGLFFLQYPCLIHQLLLQVLRSFTGVLLLPVTSQQLLAQPQKPLLAPASCKYVGSELKMQLVHRIRH